MSGLTSDDLTQYVFFAPELVRLLHDNGIATEEFLLRAGAAGLKPVPDPAASDTKDAMISSWEPQRLSPSRPP